MSEHTVIFLGAIVILVLLFIIIYQRFTFNKGIQTKLRQMAKDLEKILETHSDEKIMVFTDNRVLMELAEQMNELLIEWQKTKVDFVRQKLSSKKMLSNISHDIKTPLTVVLGYLEIMGLDKPEDEMLKKVETKVNQVMDMINQFFTLAKLEAGDTSLKLEKIHINEVCRENILSFYDILLQKGFSVEISIQEAAIFIQGDKEALHRILSNLLTNAIRYGSQGKYLGLFLRQDESFAYIDVVDKGKGIDREFAHTVFERLYTMEDSRNREVQGNGLGLTIAKNLAVQLGGDLYLDSIPNEKTTFTVKLKKFPVMDRLRGDQ